MKTGKQKYFNSTNILRLLMFTSSLIFSCQPQTVTAAPLTEPLPIDNPFFLRNYGGKCLDFGSASHANGTPVFIYSCNGTNAQRVSIQEINERHDVILRAGDKVIGVNYELVNTDGTSPTTLLEYQLSSETPLELQNEMDRNTISSLGQIFALDGDSIILAANRNLVVEVKHSLSANGTPLVLGYRDLNDAEFWMFTAIDGSNRRPTGGFVSISQDDGEMQARIDFLNALNHAHWGTVIELDSSVSLSLTDRELLSIPEGVTIRGDRRGVGLGPELRTAHTSQAYLFDLAGDHVRLTGLRLHGPSRSLNSGYTATAILAHRQYKTIIDHNDLSDWPVAAIEVSGDGIPDSNNLQPENVRIERNFIHHNRGEGLGYGVVTGYSGYALIRGNTFVENRHAIAGDGTETSGYRAWFNIVLYAAPDYKPNDPFHGRQQDFDMHGMGNDPCQHCGGIAGKYIEIARNTFLGANRLNFYLRGTPTDKAEFHHNVLRGWRASAIENLGEPVKLIINDNQFLSPHPARHLGVGDFDGDGVQDLFMSTGAAWYYAPAGKAEWRLLNSITDTINTLLFGDFDADGRTDIFTQHNYNWDVSWGGVSPWEHINVSWPILGNVTIGDFIGDERDDIFYADGQNWYASDAGVGQFAPLDASSFRVISLRFGDFNADGKTDVFGVANGEWSVAYNGTSGWTRLRAKLTDSVAGLTVADFNGDGRADVATSTRIFWPLSSFGNYEWKVSFSGTDMWRKLREAPQSMASVGAVGRFDDNLTADVLLWHSNYLDISAGGSGTFVRQSRQDMR